MAASVLCDFTHDAALALEELQFDVAVFLVAVVGIVVSADKIAGDVVSITEIDKLLDPFALRCRRSANLQRRRDGFDRVNCASIKFEVFALTAAPKRLQIGFIPDFKKPTADFSFAVTIDKMRYQTLDEHRPLFVIFWRRHISFVPEYGSLARS